MNTTWDTQVRVMKGIVIFNALVIMIGVLTLKNWKPFIIGNLYGSIIAILNFRLLAIATEKSITMLPEKASKYSRNQIFIRLFINLIVIYVSLTVEHINTIGTVIGLLSIKPIVLKEGLTSGTNLSKKNHKRKEEN